MKLVNGNIKFIKQNSYALLNEKSNFYTQKKIIMHVIFFRSFMCKNDGLVTIMIRSNYKSLAELI